MSTIDGQPEHKAGAVRTSAEDRATLPGAGADAPTDREAAEDPRNRHPIRPRRADPRRNADRMQKPAGAIATGATTRRAAPCIAASPNKYPQPEQTPHRTPYTEPERIRANLPRWTEAHGTPTEHARSHVEPLLLILRTFTHKHINHA